MKFIKEQIEVMLTQHGVKGTHTYSCTITEKDYGYLLTGFTEIDGKKSGVSVPFSKGIQQAYNIPLDDFELTVTV